jgi:hypothetical protein
MLADKDNKPPNNKRSTTTENCRSAKFMVAVDLIAGICGTNVANATASAAIVVEA